MINLLFEFSETPLLIVFFPKNYKSTVVFFDTRENVTNASSPAPKMR